MAISPHSAAARHRPVYWPAWNSIDDHATVHITRLVLVKAAIGDSGNWLLSWCAVHNRVCFHGQKMVNLLPKLRPGRFIGQKQMILAF